MKYLLIIVLLISLKSKAQNDTLGIFAAGDSASFSLSDWVMKDSTWMEDKVDTIKTQWVLIANSRGFVRKFWLKEIVNTYTEIKHSENMLSQIYRPYNEKYINRRYFINKKPVNIICYQPLDSKLVNVIFIPE